MRWEEWYSKSHPDDEKEETLITDVHLDDHEVTKRAYLPVFSPIQPPMMWLGS